MIPLTIAGTVRLRRGPFGGCLLLQTPERSAAVRCDDYADLLAGKMRRPIDVTTALYDRVGRATIAQDALHVELAGRHYHVWCSDIAALLEGRRESIPLGRLTPEYSITVPVLSAGRLLHA
ncbi:MAG TPA: hypothetical protein HA263_07865 [Methanoregulaceae archaeon]|nr:hypothetical protein [Methanoregulaceae archaeon]